MLKMGFAWKVAWLVWALVLSQVVAALAAVSGPPDARDAARSDAATTAERRALDRLLQGSGLKAQLESMSGSVRSQFIQSARTDQDRITIARIVAARFDAEALYARIGLELSQNLDTANLANALAWYDSLAGGRVTAIELAALRPDVGHQPSLDRETYRPSPGRVALVERLDAGLGGSETTVDVTVAVVRSLVRVFQPALPGLSQLSRDQLDDQLAVARNRTLKALRPAYVASMLAVYRDLSDAELAEYVRFVESEAGRWYMGQTNSALLRAIDVAARAAAAELATALPPLAAELR